ncbi:MAG: 4Fe-4S binding protein [Bacteroidales bacterium]|nr:4Fe-4S binding protein [Bacteroidales bacterium]
MNKNLPLIYINNDKCKVCYACVRVCPVKAIQVKPNHEFPVVGHNRCIGCGACLEVCSPGAITYKNDKDRTKDILKSDSQTAAIVDPAIASEFSDITDYRKFVEMLRVLGFNHVLEVSFAVDLIARQYKNLFEDFKGKYYISANCPVVVDYVEKYVPELTTNIARIISPMIASAKVSRKLYGQDLKIVHIGPCIAQKREATKYDGDAKVDAVLTFSELRELLDESQINEKSLKYSDFDQPLGYKGALYPISKGIIEAANINDNYLVTDVMTRDGGSRVLSAIKEFEEHINRFKHHLNLFYCEGCMMGPGMSTDTGFLLRKNLVTEYSRKRLQDFDVKSWEKSVKIHDEMDYTTSFEANDIRIDQPDQVKVDEILGVIGRHGADDKLGCGSCGYDSCTHFAESVAKGLTRTDMCITYSLKNQQEYIKILKNTNDKLAQTQEKLKDSEQQIRKEHAVAVEALSTSKSMMEELRGGVVLIDEHLKIISSNKGFIRILGDEAKEINEIIPGLVGADLKTLIPYQFYNMFSYVLSKSIKVENKDVQLGDNLLNVSIFPIKKNKIVGAIIRDMYEPEIQREEVMNRVTDVIDQNLAMVQQIGFLLGEGASQTEKMLNSIIKSYKSEKK